MTFLKRHPRATTVAACALLVLAGLALLAIAAAWLLSLVTLD